MPDTNSESEKTGLTQQTYKSTRYEDQSWEVIGEIPETQVFVPMEIEILPQTEGRIDPMFADYGGGMGADKGQIHDNRWTLPDISKKGAKSKKNVAVDEEEEEKLFTEDEVADLIKEAEARGKLEALEEAINLQNEKLGKIEQSMNGILRDLHAQLVENLAATEKYALELTLSISEKLMHHIVDTQPEYIANVINEAISLCGSANVKKIRISPQDMEFIEVVGITKNLKQTDLNWEFEADPAIRTGCVIETTAGEVDYQLDEAFNRIKDNVLKVKK